MSLNHQVQMHRPLVQVLAFQPSELHFSMQVQTARSDPPVVQVLHNLHVGCASIAQS